MKNISWFQVTLGIILLGFVGLWVVMATVSAKLPQRLPSTAVPFTKEKDPVEAYTRADFLPKCRG